MRGDPDVAYLNHDGELPDLSDELLRLAIVDLVFQCSRQLTAIRDVALSALGWEYLAILSELIGYRNL